MAITPYDRTAVAAKKKEEADLVKWIREHSPKAGPTHVGGGGGAMFVDRDVDGRKLELEEYEKRKQELVDLRLTLQDEAAMAKAYPAPEKQKLEDAAKVAFADPNAERARTLSAELGGLGTANITGDTEVPDVFKRAQGDVLGGRVTAPQSWVDQLGMLYRTSMPFGMAMNQETLGRLMLELNNAKPSANALNIDDINTLIDSYKTPAPTEAATLAALESKRSGTPGSTIESILADSLSASGDDVTKLRNAGKGLRGLGAEANAVVKGRQAKVLGGGALLTATGAGGYAMMSGPSERDKMIADFRSKFYAGPKGESGGPGSDLINPKDDAAFGEAAGKAWASYADAAIGPMGTSSKRANYKKLMEAHRDTIAAIGRGETSISDDATLDFRKALADWYSVNHYPEKKGIAFPYRDESGNTQVLMTDKLLKQIARLRHGGEFEGGD